jgi:hypothetical protein
MRPTLLHPSATSRPVSSGRLLAYVVREHRRGRPLRDILGDGFVLDHATNAEVGLLLENPHPDQAAGRRDAFAAGKSRAAASGRVTEGQPVRPPNRSSGRCLVAASAAILAG